MVVVLVKIHSYKKKNRRTRTRRRIKFVSNDSIIGGKWINAAF